MVKKHKSILTAFLVGLFFATSISIVSAASAASPWLNYSCYGKNYSNICRVYVQPSYGASADCQVNSNSGYVPSGYMGVCSRLYDSNNNLWQSVDWQYNLNSTNGIVSATGFNTVRANYHSHGMTQAYNGNGYNTYWCYQSPTLTY